MSAILQPGAMRIRTLVEDDLDRVIEIEQLAYDHPWTIGIFRDCLRVGYICQILEQDGEIHGYSVMSDAVGEAHILNICIRQESQRSGLGRLLVENMLTMARRMTNEIILLEVRPSNKVAIALYHDMGFSRSGQSQGLLPGP